MSVEKVNQDCTDFCYHTSVLFSFCLLYSFMIFEFPLCTVYCICNCCQTEMSNVCYKFPQSTRSTGVIRGFPKIDRSGIDARIVLEQNKIQQKCYL